MSFDLRGFVYFSCRSRSSERIVFIFKGMLLLTFRKISLKDLYLSATVLNVIASQWSGLFTTIRQTLISRVVERLVPQRQWE